MISFFLSLVGSHGLIEFSIAYDEAAQNVHVNVIKAKVIELPLEANTQWPSVAYVRSYNGLFLFAILIHFSKRFENK